MDAEDRLEQLRKRDKVLKQQNAAQRTLQKRILRYEAAALWMLIQATFEGR